MILTGVIAVLLLGLVLLVMGVRGRRINDHPVCRGCRFDLVGIYPAVQTCPECGRGLRSSMVRTGVRRRRRRMAILGGILTLAGVIAAAGARDRAEGDRGEEIGGRLGSGKLSPR